MLSDFQFPVQQVKAVTSEYTTRKKLNWKSTPPLGSIRELRLQDQPPAPKLKNQTNTNISSLLGETTTEASWVEKRKRNWPTARQRAHTLERLKTPGKSTLWGPLHFHEFYLQKPHQVCRVKNKEKSPLLLEAGEGKVTILKHSQSISLSLTKGCPQGILFYQSLTKWRKGSIQIRPFLLFMSHMGKGGTCEGESQQQSPLKDWDLMIGPQSTSPNPTPYPLTSTGNYWKNGKAQILFIKKSLRNPKKTDWSKKSTLEVISASDTYR